jgi:hypothetical protein
MGSETVAVRTKMIKSHIALLSTRLCRKQPVERAPLLSLYYARDYPGMVRLISNDLMLQDLRFRVGIVNSGGPDVPAWISLPRQMPAYGSPEFKGMRVTVFLRRSFLENSRFETVVLAIAHELSHVVLDAIGHVLRTEEEAVDLTAMMLGYGEYYRVGCRYSRTERFWYRSRGIETKVGYLTPEEVVYAANRLNADLNLGARLKLFVGGLFTENSKRVLAIIGLAACLWWIFQHQDSGKTVAIDLPQELRPPFGSDIALSRNQIRYCLSEEIRIDGAKDALNLTVFSEVNDFNSAVDDYNSRCGSFRYRSGELEDVRLEVEAKKYLLRAEGASRVGLR